MTVEFEAPAGKVGSQQCMRRLSMIDNPMPTGKRFRGKSCSVLGMRVDEMCYEQATERILEWAQVGESRYICVSTVHMIMESYDDDRFRSVVNGADMIIADGTPIIWVTRLLGLHAQQRVFGPELTERLCALVAARGIRVGFFGSSSDVLTDLIENLTQRHPGLLIAFQHAPPFRPLTPAEDLEIISRITESKTQILFVGLGCPKQEHWMFEHRGRFAATMLGVGWAFDVLAGRSKTAPSWIQQSGLQWLYRLIFNPQKLWWRHLKHNPRFIFLIILQLLRIRHFH